MKKVIKFLCLLLIAALIAILVLKNGAKADGNVESAGFDKESVDVDKEIQLTVKFPKAVTSCSGTFTCSGDGAVTDTSGRQSLEHLTGTTDSPTFTLIGATPGNVTINFNFTTVSYEDGTSDVNVTGSASTIVNGAEPVKKKIEEVSENLVKLSAVELPNSALAELKKIDEEKESQENKKSKAKKEDNTEKTVLEMEYEITDSQLDPVYIQSLLDRIASLKEDGSVDKSEIRRLSDELDAIFLKLRQKNETVND